MFSFRKEGFPRAESVKLHRHRIFFQNPLMTKTKTKTHPLFKKLILKWQGRTYFLLWYITVFFFKRNKKQQQQQRREGSRQRPVSSVLSSGGLRPWWCVPLWWGNRRFCESCWRRSWWEPWPAPAAVRPAVGTRSAEPACTPGRPPEPAAPPGTTTHTRTHSNTQGERDRFPLEAGWSSTLPDKPSECRKI